MTAIEDETPDIDPDGLLHVIDQHSDVLFTWDYKRSRPVLVKLYEKAKSSQWNGATGLDWSTAVDMVMDEARHLAFGIVDAVAQDRVEVS